MSCEPGRTRLCSRCGTALPLYRQVGKVPTGAMCLACSRDKSRGILNTILRRPYLPPKDRPRGSVG